MIVAHYRYQHEGMIALADQIIGVAARGDRDDAGTLGRLRLAFSRAVAEHCEEEGATVRDAVAKGLIGGELASASGKTVMLWRADVALCNSEWPTRSILESPHGFIRRFRPLVDALRQAAEQEEREILTVIEARRRSMH